MMASLLDVAAERLLEHGAHAGVVHRADVDVADLAAGKLVDLGCGAAYPALVQQLVLSRPG